ncbi:hypothetical protein J4G07_20120 [Candidatus Poribacteria bacterium]|nr:hypothetical protein [Candidatus Poribacteria bacterium]
MKHSIGSGLALMPNMRDCCVNFDRDAHNAYMGARTEIRMRVCPPRH